MEMNIKLFLGFVVGFEEFYGVCLKSEEVFIVVFFVGMFCRLVLVFGLVL